MHCKQIVSFYMAQYGVAHLAMCSSIFEKKDLGVFLLSDSRDSILTSTGNRTLIGNDSISHASRELNDILLLTVKYRAGNISQRV